jgi:uncharacterized protein (TIGR00369 family)
VRESFARQQFMTTIRAELVRVAAGEVDIQLPHDPSLTQQHGFVHAGVVIAAVDSACGYAALTLMAAEVEVLTVELKVNLLEPATGQRLLARGRVLRSGRTLTVCRGEAVTINDEAEVIVATPWLSGTSTVRTRTWRMSAHPGRRVKRSGCFALLGRIEAGIRDIQAAVAKKQGS